MKRIWLLSFCLMAALACPNLSLTSSCQRTVVAALQEQEEESTQEETQEKTEEAKPDQEAAQPAQPPAQDPAAEEAAPQEAAPTQPNPQEAPLTKEVISEELNNPCGLAIQPETGTLFVSDSGNLQILRLVDGKLEPVITDFPKDIYGKGPEYAIGPLGITFLDRQTLVVGGGGMKDGEELLRVYKVPEVGEASIKADQMETSMGLPADGDVVGEGNFYAVISSETALFATLNGDDNKGWIGMATREGNTLKEFKRFIATKDSVQVDAPVGICLTGDGYLAVGQMGEISVPGDSMLLFYNQQGEFYGDYKTGLSDITSLAYSDAGHLYALDFSWHDTSKGGLFRLVAEGDSDCIAKPMMDLEKPTSMIFDQAGNLWVTTIGTADSADQGGQLIKIIGLPSGR